MGINLIEHLPDILRDFYEIREKFKAENPEFDKIYDIIYRWYKNISPKTGDEECLKRFEDLLNLRPLPGDTLEDRRYRVVLKLNTRLPYTEIQLRKMLAAICGWEGFSLEVKDLEVHLKVTEENNKHLRALFEMLRDVLPMNLLYVLTQIVEHEERLRVATKNTTKKRVETRARPVPRYTQLGSAGRALKIVRTHNALQGSSVYMGAFSRIIKIVTTRTKRIPLRPSIATTNFNKKIITTGNN